MTTALPLSLMACFDASRAEILLLDEKVVSIGEYAEFFHAYFMFDGDLWSLNGRYPVLPYYGIGTPGFHDDAVFLKRYVMGPRGYEVAECIDLGPGGDPRVVSDGSEAYGIIIANPLAKHKALLYDVRRRSMLPIIADGDFVYGKNWQPYLRNGELHFVHQLTPFRTMRIDTRTGHATPLLEADVDFRLPQFHPYSLHHTPFPMFRGGCNALVDGDLLCGLGRATSQRYRHHPFFWGARSGQDLSVVFTTFFQSFQRCGFNIIDPTSLFFHQGDLHLGLCCSERDWAHTQVVSQFLIAFRSSPRRADDSVLEAYFKRRATGEANGVPDLSRHLFFCIEMPSAVASMHELGGRVSIGASGHLVHGPYLQAPSGQYVAEFSYLTRTCTGPRAGVFDVTVSRLDADKRQCDFVTLTSTDLHATEGGMRSVRLAFDLDPHAGRLLEFRVFVDEGVIMNAFQVRTWSDRGRDGAFPWSGLD